MVEGFDSVTGVGVKILVESLKIKYFSLIVPHVHENIPHSFDEIRDVARYLLRMKSLLTLS